MDDWQNKVHKGVMEDGIERQAKVLPLTRRKNFSLPEIRRKEESYMEEDKLVDIKKGN